MHLTCRCASPLPCLCRPSPGGAGVRCARRFAAPQISGRLPVPGERRPNRAETAAAAAPCRRSYCTCGCRSMPTPTPFSSSLPTSRSCQRRPRSRPVRPGPRLYSLVLACSATRLRGAPRSTRATAHASLSRTLLLHGRVRACLSLPLAGRAGVPAVPTAARHATHASPPSASPRQARLGKGSRPRPPFPAILPRGFAEAASFPIVFPFPEILNLFLYSILSRRVCFLCGAGEAVAARPGRGEWPPGSTSTTARRRPAAPHAEGRCAPPRTALGHRRFSVRGRRIKSVAVVAAARRDTTARGRGRGEVKFTHLPLDRRCRSVSERDRSTD